MNMDPEQNRGVREVLEDHERHRDSLIPILQEVQKKLGFISEEAIGVISGHLDISENDIYGVATFYTQFRFTRPGDHIVRICRGTACHVRGGKRIMNEVTKYLGIAPGETTQDYKFGLESVACFGSCALSPVVVMNEKVYGRMTPQRVKKLLKDIE